MRRAPQSPVLQCWNVDRRNCPPWLRRKRRLRQSFDIDVEEKAQVLHDDLWDSPAAGHPQVARLVDLRLACLPVRPAETHPLIPELPPRQCGSGKATPQPFLSRPALALLADMADNRQQATLVVRGVMGLLDTLLVAGIFLVVAGLLGGGLKLAGSEIKSLGPGRSALAFILGLLLIGGQWMARESEQFKVVSAEITVERHRDVFLQLRSGVHRVNLHNWQSTGNHIPGSRRHESSPGTHRHTGRHRTSAGHWHREVDVGSRSAAADRSGRDAASGCLGP